MPRIRRAPARLAEKDEKSTYCEKEQAIVGGKSRAKKKDTDSEQNTGSTTNNKKPNTGEVNSVLLKTLKAVEMPVANPEKTNGDEAAEAEGDDDDGGQRE